MNTLDLLKQRLLKQSNSEQDAVNNFCMIMEICGGHTQLMNLPLPAIEPILKYLKFKREQEDKRLGFGKRMK